MVATQTRLVSNPRGPRTNNRSDHSLRAIVDACISNVAVLDESGTILCASNAWLGFLQATAAGTESFDLAPYYFESCKRIEESQSPDTAEISLEDDLQRIITGEEREFHRKYICRSLNEQRPFVMHAARLNLPGSTFRVLLTHEDISSGPDQVNQSNERLTALLNTTKIVAWEGEVENQRFTYVSDQAFKMLGYPAIEWCKENFLAAHIHPDDHKRVLAEYMDQTSYNGQLNLTFRMIAADGQAVWVENLISVTRDNARTGRLHGFMIDISERKQAEEALEFLGTRLIAAQEDERKRVARELHDDLNQRLAVMSIGLEELGREIQQSSRFNKRVEKLQLQVQEISNDIHRLSYKLHPAKLDHLGLGAAIKGLCDELRVSKSGKPRLHFHQSGMRHDVSKDVALCVYRIAQEVLRNCVKHSGAESAQVVLNMNPSRIQLSVSDNGCGFDTKSDLMKKGLGFISMKERLRIVGGTISISSQPQRGTRIDVSVPVDRDVEVLRNRRVDRLQVLAHVECKSPCTNSTMLES
ncbi:MAG TPA: PAS domain S-box protein [Pyrinomonadaceae bacterium]